MRYSALRNLNSPRMQLSRQKQHFADSGHAHLKLQYISPGVLSFLLLVCLNEI